MAAAPVQTKMGGGISNGGTIVMNSNVTAGNHLIVYFPWSYVPCPPSFTDNLGNTYTAVGTHPIPTGGTAAFFLFVAPITTGGACTLTLAAACGNNVTAFAVEEVSGLAANPFDQQNANVVSASPGLAGSITPTENGEYIGALFNRIGGSATTFTPGSGWTQEATTTNAIYEDLVQAVAAAINADVTYATGNVVGYVASFKAAGGGGATPVAVMPNLLLMGVG